MNFSNLLENNIPNDISPLSSFNENFNNYEDFKSDSEPSKCATCPSQVDPSAQVKKVFQDTNPNPNPNSKSAVSDLMNKTGLNTNSSLADHPPMCNCAPCSMGINSQSVAQKLMGTNNINLNNKSASVGMRSNTNTC